jgi:opacity protein-like surface antigen
VYTGAVFTNKTDLTISSSLGSTTTYQDLHVNNSLTAGGRGGYWVDQLDWLGFGLDLFFFHVKAPNQAVSVTGPGPTATSSILADWNLPVFGVGFDVLRLRAPLLRSEEFTHGRLQPFLSAGPALFVTWAGQNRNVQPQGQNGTDVALGAKAEAGVTFLLTKTVGLFTEYRFTHFTSKLSYQNTTPSPATEFYKATYDSHQVIGGISFRF